MWCYWLFFIALRCSFWGKRLFSHVIALSIRKQKREDWAATLCRWFRDFPLDRQNWKYDKSSDWLLDCLPWSWKPSAQRSWVKREHKSLHGFCVCSVQSCKTTYDSVESGALQLYEVSPFHQGQLYQTQLGAHVSETQCVPRVTSSRHPVSEHLQTNPEAVKNWKAH